MTNVVTINHETDVINTLKNSLYPGAADDSIQMVLSYCRAAKLDPLQKPVHIVPMSVKQGDRYVYRDVIMPGIGLYRIQAARTGEYAGVSKPEFGPIINKKLDGIDISFPEWCDVTVIRLVEGQPRNYTATEFWLENYAPAKKDTSAPNTMWKKRPFGQLAKCAEAQALRKAFPEHVGAQPTAEEMEGKSFEPEDIKNERKRIMAAMADQIPRSDDSLAYLRNLIIRTNTPPETIEKWLAKAAVKSLDDLTPTQWVACINALEQKVDEENKE